MSLPILNILYKRNYTICDLLCPTFSLYIVFLKFIQNTIVACINNCPVLWLNDTPFGIYIYIYHNLFIHSCVEHLGYFHLLAIKNVATMYIHVQVSAWTYVFISLGYIPRCLVVVINNV